jgi:proline iminopeptidase
MILETQLIDVGGATLEVGIAGSGEPVICQSHPLGPMAPDYDPGSGWESGIGRLVVINPRGIGRSSGQNPRDFTFRQHVDDLEAVRRQLGVDRWVFWGQSGGGVIGLLYTLAYPGSLAGAIIECASGSGARIAQDERSNLCPRYPEYQAALADASGNESHLAIQRALYPALATAEWRRFGGDRWVLVRGEEKLIVCPSDVTERARAGFEEFLITFDVEDRLAEIQVPMLIVAGPRDISFPFDHVDLLRDGIASARLEILETFGHGIETVSADAARRQEAARRFLAGVTMPMAPAVP